MNPALLLNHGSGAVEPPTWTDDERLNARADWLRVGQTPWERMNHKFSRAMAFAGMDDDEQDSMLQAAIETGCTHYVYERELVVLPGYWTWDRPMTCTPEQMLTAAQKIVAAGLIPVPLLLTQDEVRERTIAELVEIGRPYRVLAKWIGFCWLLFEVNESVTLKNPDGSVALREGMRADDWITALMGEYERVWGTEMGVHWTGPERHYHDRYEAPNLVPAGMHAPMRPLLLFQFSAWDADGAPYLADINAVMQYQWDEDVAVPMTSGAVHATDWVQTLDACFLHSPRQRVLAWEYCPFDWWSTPAQFRQMGDHIVEAGRESTMPFRVTWGNGGTL